MKNRSLLDRLGFARDGLTYAWRAERSFRTQVGCAAAVVAILLALRPGWGWAGLIVLCVALVLALELVNAALEALIDHVHPEIAPAIKHAKDAAAAAVLVAAAGAVGVGAMMLLSVAQGW